MLLDGILNNKKLVFDVGANYGSKTGLFLKYHLKVICIEPQTECLTVLYNKFKTNDVIIIPKALSSDGKKRKFRTASENTLSTFSEIFIEKTIVDRFKNYVWHAPKEIDTIKLDDVIDSYGIPDFCKIDVEGSEKEVLLGLSRVIPCLSFEYTPELHNLAVDCLKILVSIGDYSFNYSEGESLNFSLDTWMGKEEIARYLLSIKDKIIFGDIYAMVRTLND